MSLIFTVLFTTICWIITAYLGPKTDQKTLTEFYQKVRPFGPGWKKIRFDLGISETKTKTERENIPLGLLGWISGCIVIWSALFTVGTFLYGRTLDTILLFGVFIISGIFLLYVINKVWDQRTETQD